MKLLLTDKTEITVDRISDSISDGTHQLMIACSEKKSAEEVNAQFEGKTETVVITKDNGEMVTLKGYTKISNINREISDLSDTVMVTLKKE